MPDTVPCPHCRGMYEPHQIKCACGHYHSQHVFAGGCKKCDCDRYNAKPAPIAGKIGFQK